MDAKDPSETILQEAARLVGGDRQQAYGSPSLKFARVAQIWTAVLGSKLREGVTLDAGDVALCQIGEKLARESIKPRRDNRADMAGYAQCLDMIREAK
jgi:hypothetical protein